MAKVRIFSEVRGHKLEENFKVVDAEDAAVVYLAALAGGKDFYIAPKSVNEYRNYMTLRSASVETGQVFYARRHSDCVDDN